jgi:hypothetical protein
MQLTGKITPETLMSLEAYTKWRKVHKPEVIAHRKLRSVQLGDHINMQFESETTIRYQIQEMLRIENRGLCPAGAGRQQLEGHHDDRVRRHQRAQARTG